VFFKGIRRNWEMILIDNDLSFFELLNSLIIYKFIDQIIFNI